MAEVNIETRYFKVYFSEGNDELEISLGEVFWFRTTEAARDIDNAKQFLETCVIKGGKAVAAVGGTIFLLKRLWNADTTVVAQNSVILKATGPISSDIAQSGMSSAAEPDLSQLISSGKMMEKLNEAISGDRMKAESKQVLEEKYDTVGVQLVENLKNIRISAITLCGAEEAETALLQMERKLYEGYITEKKKAQSTVNRHREFANTIAHQFASRISQRDIRMVFRTILGPENEPYIEDTIQKYKYQGNTPDLVRQLVLQAEMIYGRNFTPDFVLERVRSVDQPRQDLIDILDVEKTKWELESRYF